ncbi:unnamed protein product [Aphanomyces euteiches]
MGNQVTLETTELGSQLYDPLVLTSDTFLAKSYVQLYVQGPDFVDVDGEVCFSVRQTTHIAFWKRSVECVHSDGNVVASLRSGVTYAGKSLDQPTGLFKTRRIRKTSKILISGGKQVQASVDSKGKKAILHRGNSTIAIVYMAAADKWTLLLAPGVDMTLGIFFVETVKKLFN